MSWILKVSFFIILIFTSGSPGYLTSEKTYGNSVVLNSMDVANVAEGDYDFDKADFFFAHKD